MPRAIVCVLVGLILVEGTARADFENILGGLVVGFARADGESHGLIGVEGGVGFGPERFNVGAVRRDAETFVYGELDPWWFVGASLGFGYGTTRGAEPVVGVWEGLPMFADEDCGPDWQFLLTISVGYRFTGVHELYVSPKVGQARIGCID
jgi:hypothetical protein